MSGFNEFMIGLVCILAFVLVYQRRAFIRDAYEAEFANNERIAAFQRLMTATNDANAGLRCQLQAAHEELGASQVQVGNLVREKADLLQCNFELQRTVILRGEIIKYLSPYQAIRSTMPWGKN
jgi:hypothetical protein